jgi:hypothetical protein
MRAYTLRLGAIVALLVSCAAVWAQGTAQINGTAKDASGAAVPGAEIQVTQTAMNAVRTTTSGTDGSYVLPDLAVGPYTLEITKEGFNKYRQSLQAAQSQVVDRRRTGPTR